MTLSPMARRLVRYGLAGLVATGIYFVSVVALVEWGHFTPVSAAVVATMIVIVTSYVINRVFVFETDRPHGSAFGRFVAASLIGIALNTLIMHVATRVMMWPYMAGAAVTVLIVPPVNFLINQYWAFRRVDA